MKTPDIMNSLNAYSKVLKTILSCVTHEQLRSADRMIDNFKELHGVNAYSRELDSVWLMRGYDNIPYHEEWQPCGRAHQQAGNAEYQSEMLEQCKKDESDRYLSHMGNQ